MGKGRRLFCVLLLILLHIVFLRGVGGTTGSAGDNYAIPTYVFPGGGAAMGSANFSATGTLGQSSTLMDPPDPPYSSDYQLYPGFWYTVAISGGCDDLEDFALAFGHTAAEQEYGPYCDSDHDGDVDGLDLAWHANSE